MNDQGRDNESAVGKRSSRIRTILASLLLVIVFPQESPAPIYGLFPGLSALIESADAVVVADIVAKPTTMDLSWGGVFKLSIRKALKGEMKEAGTYSVHLRDLPFRIGQSNLCLSLFPDGLVPGARGVFFLKKGDRLGLGAEFGNENCEGDAFSINRNVDLKKTDGLAPQKAVEFLLEDCLAYQRERFRVYEAAITNMLATP